MTEILRKISGKFCKLGAAPGFLDVSQCLQYEAATTSLITSYCYCTLAHW